MRGQFRTQHAHALGRGPSSRGVARRDGHFIALRVTSIALAILAPWFAIAGALSIRDASYLATIDFISNPVNAVGVICAGDDRALSYVARDAGSNRRLHPEAVDQSHSALPNVPRRWCSRSAAVFAVMLVIFGGLMLGRLQLDRSHVRRCRVGAADRDCARRSAARRRGLKTACVTKVYPTRSHTVAAQGGIRLR